MKNITWDNFKAVQNNPRYSFEQLCRILFKRKFLNETSVLTSSPNHPGVETAPVFSQELGKNIAFQSKFFQDRVNYRQIQESVQTTIDNYTGSLDIFYLYCNKDLSLNSKPVQKIESDLKNVNIDFKIISNDEILSEIINYNDLQSFFFGNHTITKDWFKEYNQLSFDSLGNRYNPTFNVTTRTEEKIQLFVKEQSAIDRINTKKVNLIKNLDSLYPLESNDLIHKIKTFVNSLEDVTVEKVETCLKWNSEIKSEFKDEIKNLIATKDELKAELETITELSGGQSNKIFNKISNIDRLLNWLDFFGCSEDDAALIENKILVITGEAGIGKSQLFAITVRDIVDNGGYALLLLGHHYNSSNDIMAQIMERFDFSFGFLEFLDILDVLGETKNETIYIFIDAINETSCKDVWKNGLSKIITEVNKHKHIKLVLSIRTGYEKLVLEEKTIERIQNREILQIKHYGFQDVSVKAMKEFLDFYNIPFSPSDLLNYEMTNPLYLKLFCETYDNEELNLFQMFERRIVRADEEIQRVLEIPDSGEILKYFLLEVAKWQFNHNKNSINRNELFRLEFWSDYGIQKKPYFLSNLLKSGLIISYPSKNDEEVYSFGYNLLEDYLKAQVIQKEFSEKKQSKEYLEHVVLKIENGKIINWNNIDVFLFACYFYYEKFNEDCIEFIKKISDQNDCYELATRYIKSFSWRPAHTLSKEQFRDIANNYPIDQLTVLQVLVENSTRAKNPINANFLHEVLWPKKMADRDEFWLPFINSLADESQRIFQLITLFDNDGQVGFFSVDNVKLLLVLFTWLLASSNRKLRDITSKAMIEVLKVNFEFCEYLLRKFENVNDPYIIQRLYAIIFGASVKRVDNFEEEFQSLAEFVYLSIFNKETVYPDILLRDYARLIIERFLFEFPSVKLEIEKSKILPPYNSDPIPVVNSEAYDSDDKFKGFARIDSSMRPEGVGMYGDFGRYVFQSALTYFKDVNIENLYHYAMQFIRDELGYTSNKCLSDYDCRRHHPLDRSRGHLVERIGKKYQWIAFYNILARISDYHKLKWDDVEDNVFKGPWEPYVRDFDPTLNYHTLQPLDILPKFNIEYEMEFCEQKLDNKGINDWISDKPRLFSKSLSYKDNNGIEWVILYQNKELKYQPEEYVDDSLGFIEGEQRIWRIVEAYFIKNTEFDEFIKNVQDNKFLRNNISGGAPYYYQFFNREFAWASSVKGTNNKYDYYVETGEKKIERQIKTNVDFSDGKLKIEKIEEDVVINVTKLIASLFPAHIQFLWEEEYDFSKDDTISFDIPCPELISKLNLSQKDYDGYFYSPTGELVAFDGNITNSIDGLVIRKDFLDKFLEENGLSIIWVFLGEKQYFTQNPREQYYCRWDGIFWEEKHSVKNKICINEQKTCEKD